MTQAIARINSAASRRVRQGYPWIYREQILEWLGEVTPGALVTVQDATGQSLGVGYANPATTLCIRMLYSLATAALYPAGIDERVEIGRKLDRARSRRLLHDFASNAIRWVWSEADGLPGMVIDEYAGIVVLQCLTLGAEQRKAWVCEWLISHLKIHGIYERSQGQGRRLEGLEERNGWLWHAEQDSPPPEVEIQEGPLRFRISFTQGHKTGFYLDQRASRRKIYSQPITGRVLDGCAYTGGFSIAAAKAGASQVISVDVSRSALVEVERNAELNQVSHRITPCRSDIFDYLKNAVTRGEKFSGIILDPPPFARTRQNIELALNGYRELHRRAAQLLEKNGWLLTCSCSHHIKPQAFQSMVRQGIGNSGRRLVIDSIFGPDSDHPEKAQVPESRYLTCIWARVR